MFSCLQVWNDTAHRSPSEQMAMDEALLRKASQPILRTYRWQTPAITFGYTQHHTEVRAISKQLPMVRRWTGGGTVFHGKDVTLALALPKQHPLCSKRSEEIYHRIHQALLNALHKHDLAPRLARAEDCVSGIQCFECPTLHDILYDGKKICGGALRRSQAGILYQSSLYHDVSIISLERFLTQSIERFVPDRSLQELCSHFNLEKYASDKWNYMR